ncbi:dihydrofolate reductase [Mycobacteroides franklinii]|uniref:Dihydrofolate reductase n=1 Tax=Mycobacteroides franklinii TaxID=948102 RepID=A0A1S1L3W2_9MYCO|nr:dihydrofolate reductase [Mycobacteroides franklinii]NGX08517.1 dihydrofolate reductase [Mycobacteroides franklinii]OHU18156.1 dihydrofolate reductase [Mycobacteroides franklinii]ORA62550.1 dihydrofolate reductase [Mycobacteroides franklinii]TDH25914.1 dihydrofolate reductase [Mycobacteroides franklinii]TDZ45806.1 Dihydrofolate reductase [Mycobacteroides franklinii]
MTGTIGLIWAQSRAGIIGADGAIPWRLPEDQARFKRITMGHTVIMGRKTWESLPASVRPLPGRPNIVLTRDALFEPDGALAVGCTDAALAASDEAPWVIGGGEIYRLFLPLAQRCEVTVVEADVPGDALAPELDESWVVEENDWQTSESGLRYQFLSYRKVDG